ncbi:unnamed protein product [Calypogeia fissa]
MRGHLGSSGSFVRRFLLLILLQRTVFTNARINAAQLHMNEEAELQRSMARYRDLDSNQQVDHSASMRDLLQVDKEFNNPGQVKGRIVEGFVFPEPYLLGPVIKDWDEQRRNWLEENPRMKSMPNGKPRVLIVTGSQPHPCRNARGDFFHVNSLKLKIDYARMHNYEIYYNFAWLDPLFGAYWTKLPIIRKLMLTHPEIEWFIWVDSDAVFTDLLFEPPFHELDGYNMAMWAWEEGFWKKNWVSVNVGVFLIRNCQWSLNLIDKWSPMGPDGPVRVEYGKMLSQYLDRYDNYPADDQSSLIYLMLTDESVMSKIKLVENDYIISGWWVTIVDTLDRIVEKYHPGLGDRRWPWITHFTGCQPCDGAPNPNYSYENCMFNITRVFNFADNQVLAYMGYQHQNLSSPHLVRTRDETDRPFDFVGVNPWAEKIAQVAAESGRTY